MNNIDILEEKEKRLRAYLVVLNEENILYKKEDAIEGIIKLFETLIAENKELKEEKEYEKELRIKYERKYNLLKESSVKKRKVEEKIKAILDLHYNEDLKMYVVSVLQSLLGKE